MVQGKLLIRASPQGPAGCCPHFVRWAASARFWALLFSLAPSDAHCENKVSSQQPSEFPLLPPAPADEDFTLRRLHMQADGILLANSSVSHCKKRIYVSFSGSISCNSGPRGCEKTFRTTDSSVLLMIVAKRLFFCS